MFAERKNILIATCVVVLVQILFLLWIYNPVLLLNNKQLMRMYYPTRRGTAEVLHKNGIFFHANCLSCDQLEDISTNHVNSKTFDYFMNKYSLTDSNLTAKYIDKANMEIRCDGNVVVYNDLFGILHDVILYPDRRSDIMSSSKGGEEIKDVLNQDESKEFYQFNSNFLVVKCPKKDGKTSKMSWMNNVEFNFGNQDNVTVQQDDLKYTIAIRRQDYANLHNWVRNIYNTFLIMMHFKIQPVNISVLFMDGHPVSELDKSWAMIFNTPLRVGRLSQPIIFKHFILGFEETEGPVTNWKNVEVPFLEEFRSFVLSRFTLPSNTMLDCQRPKITIILRRDAVYHPRNAAGEIGRKIFNEAELLNALMKLFPRACVKAVLMDSLPMESQLDIIRQTDVLIGMHGAGMSHSIFLPKHAAILELFELGFKTLRPWNVCFHSIATWRNISYDSWENVDQSRNMPHGYTIVPVDIITNKTQALLEDICRKPIK